MSLKAVHIVVIILSIAVSFFFGFWAVRDYQATANSLNLVWGVFSFIIGAMLIPYLFWFLRKIKRAGRL